VYSRGSPLFSQPLVRLKSVDFVSLGLLFSLTGLPQGASELVVGRVLGLLDAIAMMVLAYWYGTSSSSAMKTELLRGRISL
jgi:hypothetical protein